jgi:phage-related minor tail protein
MSAITDVVGVIRDAIKLTDEVKRVGEALKTLSGELRDHDRRLTRLEAQWDTAMQFTRVRPARAPRRIKSK